MRRSLRGVSLSAALSIAVACAKGEDGIDVGDAGAADPDAGADARLTTPDGSGGKDGSQPDPQDSGGTACTGKVLINELMPTGASATEEFVELFNPNTCSVPLGGWKLGYKSKAGAGNTVLLAFGVGDSIPAKSFLVIGTASFNAKKDATMNGGMSEDGGQVGLTNDADVLVDAVGYGGATGVFVEGSAAAAPVAKGSVGRKSDGVDSDNNASDFKASAQHSAGASNN